MTKNHGDNIQPETRGDIPDSHPSGSSAKLALLTGGGRGIGRGILRTLSARGWNIVFTGRNRREDCERLCQEMHDEFGNDVQYISSDVADLNASEALVQTILDRYGQINALVNNAGVAPPVRRDILEMTPDSFDYVMGINLRGPFFLTQRVANYFLKQTESGGYVAGIVNIGSISATVASISRGEYCFSKAGVAMMTRLFASRLAAHGIPVYEIRPGIVHSEMTAVVREKYDRLIADGLTLQPRWGEPEDVGKAVAMLLNGDLAYSTGQVIYVDGGMHVERL
ncbi:MAG: 3-ketoacyl-ACP reductase [Planctomycetia bacterium]|nr:3-ketoacyl-ACP reductase [Planctomycetia bacterium]